MKKLILLGSVISTCFLMSVAHATTLESKDPSAHFFVVMENQTDQNVSISFKPVSGDVSLTPNLPDHTPLAAHQSSQKYGVIFATLGKSDSFSMIFTGQNDCVITVGFFAINDPTISMAGYGCYGAGYHIVGDTLFLTATGIHQNSV